MKKHFFTFTALALALLFSAFTRPKTLHKQIPEDPQLVWYSVNGSGQINVSTPINANEPMTASEFLQTYSLCTLGTEVDCARGFDPQYPPTSSTDYGIEQIKKNQ